MNKKFVCCLLLIIIICSAILIYKIDKTYAYDQETYNLIYDEYQKIKTNSTANDTTVNHSYSSNKPIRNYKNSTGSTYSTTGIIDIPKINISYPIINDYSESNLNIAPTKFVGPEINTPGNFVIVGHNNWNKEFFSNLNKLEKNDIITLTDHNNNSLDYKVYNIYETKQNDFSCLSQETNGKIELTLITCIKNQKNKRLIIKCIAD